MGLNEGFEGKPWNGIEIQVLRGKSIEQSLSYLGHDFICGLSLMDTSPLDSHVCVCVKALLGCLPWLPHA